MTMGREGQGMDVGVLGELLGGVSDPLTDVCVVGEGEDEDGGRVGLGGDVEPNWGCGGTRGGSGGCGWRVWFCRGWCGGDGVRERESDESPPSDDDPMWFLGAVRRRGGGV